MKIIYLIQGEADRLIKYEFLKNRTDIDTLLLSYDKAVEGALFLPDSTWAEGRNYLLETALKLGVKYDYFIFLDDDIAFINGNFIEFEKSLEELKPAVGVPVFVPKTAHTIIYKKSTTNARTPYTFQICNFADAQFLALHRDIIEDKIAVPLQTHFDSISWWCTSSTQQLLLFHFYGRFFLQFNTIQVTNECHREYTNTLFAEVQKQWFANTFRKPIRDPRDFCVNLFSYPFSTKIIKNKKIRDKFLIIKHSLRTIFYTYFYKSKMSYRIKRRKKIFH